ncbi:MAG TPA: hypothetical protein VNX01_14860, partial [Bacteroidia bacterium]|nr:hypothetical protein [Bacteroidia bacterium]
PLSLFIKYDVASQIIITIDLPSTTIYANSGGAVSYLDTTTAYYSAAKMSAASVGTATIDIMADYSDNVFVNGVPMSFYSKIEFFKPVYIK